MDIAYASTVFVNKWEVTSDWADESALVACLSYAESEMCVFCCVKLKQLSHRNVNEFVGAYISLPAVYMSFAYCSKGSLWDVINQQSTLLSWDFRVSLIIDIAKVIQLSQIYFCAVPFQCVFSIVYSWWLSFIINV